MIERAVFVGLGVLLMVLGSLIPRLPWLKARMGIGRMDVDKGARLMRQRRRAGIVLGLIVMACGAFLPLTMMPPVVPTLMAICFAALLWFRLTVPRDQVQ